MNKQPFHMVWDQRAPGSNPGTPTTPRTETCTETHTKLFWSMVALPDNPGDCWLWEGTRRSGYGRFRVRNKWTASHRYSHELLKGPIPVGMHIRHLCHNRLCCNPMHLEFGTALENIRDTVDVGRHPHGSTNGNAKLADDAVIYIRQNPDRLNGNQLAKQFGVSKTTISHVRSGKLWRHVSPPHPSGKDS